MENINKLKYNSTNQFRNVVQHVKKTSQYLGYDEEKGEPIIDNLAVQPTLKYRGTIKLHGTNANIVLQEDGTLSFHSKQQILAIGNILESTERKDFTLKKDNCGFAGSMLDILKDIKEYFTNIVKQLEDFSAEDIYPIKVSGEWCGQGVQNGVGISKLPRKSLFVFGVKLNDKWMSLDCVKDFKSDSNIIYNIMDFDTKELTIDFSNPEFSQNALVEATLEVEKECPVAKKLGLEGELVGEGLVWTPLDPDLASDTGYWFKTKGKKHSVSKTKSVAAICPEKLKSIKEFIKYSVTDNRLTQGLSEVGLSQDKVGTFVGWVNKDIYKEELDVLEHNGLTMKDAGKYIANEARIFYLNKLKDNNQGI